MKRLVIDVVRASSIVLITSFLAFAQTSTPSQEKLGLEILSFKIGSDYYPMLDRKGSDFTADNPDFPRPETERLSGRSAGRRPGIGARVEESRSRGRLRSEIKVISEAQWVNLIVRNTSEKVIKAIEWDFAFPRFVDNQLVLRYDVTSKVGIKPNGKKTLKHPLPSGTTRCKTVVIDVQEGKEAKTFEAVCGPGVHDPYHLKQESVSIKQIEYADGSIWKRQ